jgi:hypothetical protein
MVRTLTFAVGFLMSVRAARNASADAVTRVNFAHPPF